jgi:hypothetical protein
MIVLVAVGACVGAFGSYLSVRRHLKIWERSVLYI